jgi:hypothetical protein
MKYLSRRIFLALLLLISSLPTSAQEKRARPGAAAPVANEVEEAVWHVRHVAEEALHAEPLHERVRLLAVVSDLLWKKDAVYARQLLLKAFETLQDSERSEEVRDGRLSIADPVQLRQAVINVALKHDVGLSRQLLDKIEKPEESARAEDSSEQRNPEEVSKLLLASAARTFVSDEGQSQAFYEQSVARRVLPEHCYFLFKIQEKSPEKADIFFARALSALARRPLYEANELMYFASYLFSREKSINFSLVGRYNAANVNGGLNGAPHDPALARQFLTLVQTQLNPGPSIPPSLVYFALKNLAPHFQTYAPALAPHANARMAALLQDVPRGELDSNQRDTSDMTSRDEAKPVSWEERVRDAGKIQNAGRRDLEYFTALQESYLPKKDFAGAYKLVELVSDTELRQRLGDYVDFAAAQEEALKPDAPVDQPAFDKLKNPLFKTLLFGRFAASLMERKKTAQAAEALRRAEAASLGIKDDQERAQLRMFVAQTYLRLEPAVSFEMTRALIREAQKNDVIDLKQSRVQYTVSVFGLKSELPTPYAPVNLYSLIGMLGRENLREAILICDQLKNNERLWASLAAVRHALEASTPAN